MKVAPYLRFILLLVVCLTLAVTLEPRALTWSKRAQSNNVLNVLFGDGRRLFANHFFVQADVTFHSGYYPSIFDQAQKPTQSPMVSGHDEHHHDAHEEDGHDADAPGEHDGHTGEATDAKGHEDEVEEAHEKEMSFLGKPRDWIEAFGRNFMVTEHTHLSNGQEREILPWLKISADLDPQKIETYTVAAYWLRRHLGKVKEAEEFLHEGLKANPNNPQILFELGRLYNEDKHDTYHARNVWELALKEWQKTEADKDDPDTPLLEQIAVNLGRLEEDSGNLTRAISYYELAQKVSPNPQALGKQIEDLKQKVSAPPSAATH